MNTRKSFSILFCMISLLLLSACEKAEMQNSVTNKKPIDLRNVPNDCNDCPPADCCCAVGWLSGPAVDLYLCGTTTGLTGIECGPVQVNNCEIEGFILPFSVSSTNPLGYFCMSPSTALYGQNRNTSGNATSLRVSCQVGVFGPDSEDIVLSPGNTSYLSIDGSCGIALCQ